MHILNSDHINQHKTPVMSIIIASFQDPRILTAIASVRRFARDQSVEIVVVDGGSNPDLCRQIEAVLGAV